MLERVDIDALMQAVGEVRVERNITPEFAVLMIDSLSADADPEQKGLATEISKGIMSEIFQRAEKISQSRPR